jgi:internalin A
MLAYCEGADVCNIARIKSDPKDQKIFIAVSGRESTRRSFLTIIRDMFSKIHNSFANLEVSQWVPVPGHPDAEPLDYEELLGLEEMGETKVRIGKLKTSRDLRPLLDGYDAIEVRRRKQMGDDRDPEDGYPGITNHIHLHVDNKLDRSSKTTNQNGRGDNFGGDRIQGDKITGNSDETPQR